MAQSRKMSFVEAVTSNAIAFAVSLAANKLILPLFGLDVSFAQSLGITIAFTVISIFRGYFVRRLFNEISLKGEVA